MAKNSRRNRKQAADKASSAAPVRSKYTAKGGEYRYDFKERHRDEQRRRIRGW